MMANLEVKNLPDDWLARLTEQANRQGCTIDDLALEALRRELERLEWREQWQSLPLTEDGEIDGPLLIRQERALRYMELGASPEQARRDLELDF